MGCDSYQEWFHDICVGWKEATGDFLRSDCERRKKTSPSKRERKKRQGMAAKRDRDRD